MKLLQVTEFFERRLDPDQNGPSDQAVYLKHRLEKMSIKTLRLLRSEEVGGMFITKCAPPVHPDASVTRGIRAARHRISFYFWLIILLLALFHAPSVAVWAGHISWHQYSESYEVHLGVVPAAVADRDNTLRKMHAVMPHGTVKRTDGLRHIMVSVFRRSGGERVTNVEISAEVIENDLIHMKREKKELDMMMLPSGVTYCNFFTLHWNGKYEINLRILEPDKGTEWVTFYQRETAL